MINPDEVMDAGQHVIETLDGMVPSDCISVLVSVLVSLIATSFPDTGTEVIQQIAASLPKFYSQAATVNKYGELPS